MHVRREFASQEGGALYAHGATVSGVAAGYVKGLEDGDGDITLFPGAVKVWSSRGSDGLGTLYAASIRVKNAPYGHGGGLIDLHDEGITVYLSKDGSNALGSVTARACSH